jgi:GAF domain-containing protein
MNVVQAGPADSAIVETIAKCAVAVARARNREEVIDAVVDQVMALGASSASVLLAAENDERRLRLVAHRNLTPALVEGVANVTLDSPHLASRAAATRELQIIEDLAEIDPGLLSARNLLVHTHSRSMLCAPLLAFGRVLGVLTWTHPQPVRASTADRAAIRAIAELFAIGIAKAEGGTPLETTYQQLVSEVAHRQQIEAVLRDRETRLRAIFDHTFEFIGLLSTDGILLEANRASLEFIGKTRGDLVGRPFRDAPWWSGSPELQDRLSAAIARAARRRFLARE